MDFEAMKKFKMMDTPNMKNLRELSGESVLPIEWQASGYTDQDGAVHEVLALEFAGKDVLFRTEGRLFIEKFKKFAECFGTEFPHIKIIQRKSRKGNMMLDFEIDE